MNETPPPRISLRDIAKKLDLSHSTVSLALRNHPRITPEVREKIHLAAQEMGYHPDPMLSALAHYRKNSKEAPVRSSIAWVNNWPNPEDLRRHKEFDSYWKGAVAAAEKFGYYLEEFVVGPDLTPKRLEQILQARKIQGILLPPAPKGVAMTEWTEWTDFNWPNFSIVRMGRTWSVVEAHTVTSDQVANSMLAFKKMRERGYRRIGFATDSGSVPCVLFEAGYLLAQAELEQLFTSPLLSSQKALPRSMPPISKPG